MLPRFGYGSQVYNYQINGPAGRVFFERPEIRAWQSDDHDHGRQWAEETEERQGVISGGSCRSNMLGQSESAGTKLPVGRGTGMSRTYKTIAAANDRIGILSRENQRMVDASLEFQKENSDLKAEVARLRNRLVENIKELGWARDDYATLHADWQETVALLAEVAAMETMRQDAAKWQATLKHFGPARHEWLLKIVGGKE